MIGKYLEQNVVFPKGLNGLNFPPKLGLKICTFLTLMGTRPICVILITLGSWILDRIHLLSIGICLRSQKQKALERQERSQVPRALYTGS